MSALSTRPTRGDTAATTSTARLTTAITSSHSPSTLVNIALVSLGSPDSRTTRTAAATASLTPPVSSAAADGEMLKATSMCLTLVAAREDVVLALAEEEAHPGHAVDAGHAEPLDPAADVAADHRGTWVDHLRAGLPDRVGVAHGPGLAVEGLDPPDPVGGVGAADRGVGDEPVAKLAGRADDGVVEQAVDIVAGRDETGRRHGAV